MSSDSTVFSIARSAGGVTSVDVGPRDGETSSSGVMLGLVSGCPSSRGFFQKNLRRELCDILLANNVQSKIICLYARQRSLGSCWGHSQLLFADWLVVRMSADIFLMKII